MNMSPNPQIQTRFEKGLEKLKQISPEDTAGMGTALAHLHGAMEGFIRFELAHKAPHLRTAAEDPKTSWQDLLEHGRVYLGFTENDCNILTEAETQQNASAQGRGFTYSYTDLINYAQFVQKWVRWSSTQVNQVQAHQPHDKAIAPNWEERGPSDKTQHKPWYRSTFFLFIIFFVFPPLWAILILTDPGQNGLLRGLAALEIAIAMFICGYLFLPMPAVYSNAMDNILDLITGAAEPTQALSTIPTVPPVFASPPAFETDSVTSGSSACSIVWVEQSGDALAGKNRSMVWAEVIQAKVQGSGLTSSQFYEQVVEQNPHLVADGYEFKEGKTYLLPECQ